MVGVYHGWRLRIMSRIGLEKGPTHARENRSWSQAKPVIVRDGRVVGVFTSVCRRIVVVVSRCKYMNFRFRESSCYRKLLASAPLGGLIPMGILGFHETCLWGGNSSSRGGEAPRPCAPRERPRILDGKERGPGRFPFLRLLSRAGI